MAARGEIRYDAEYGHVCSCSETIIRGDDGYPTEAVYRPTVAVARDVEPTESGSWWYVCQRCGAGAWSGC